ncbi:zona pellucida sperm-binding protein 4-like [Pholidichthys leucotaenia]
MAQHCNCVQKKKAAGWRQQLALPTVTCSNRGINALFGPQVKSNVRVRGVATLLKAEESCGVKIGRLKNQSLFFSGRYDSCYGRVESTLGKSDMYGYMQRDPHAAILDPQGNKVVITLQVQLRGEYRWVRVNISCPLINGVGQETDPLPTPMEFPGHCDTERELRIVCGPHKTKDICFKMGCCYDDHEPTCYYRLNACSLDGHFVFSVRTKDAHPPIDPRSLTVKDQPHCIPAITTKDTAIFRIGVMDCGAKMREDGELLIYEVEVEELYSQSSAKHSPFSANKLLIHLFFQSLLVQCEYEPSDLKRAKDLLFFHAVTSPPPVVAQGIIRVQMRIATDASFTSFIPEDELPLTLPLREAVNVEISIVQPSPDPSLSLHVRDCFAYPASRHSVWTLLYDGCPSPVDAMRSSVPVDIYGKTTSYSPVRRFDVKTFAFLDPDTGRPSTEEMYFHCWVEICTSDIDCAQPCTIISSEGKRQRREATSDSHLQLVSFGPFPLTGQSDTDPEGPCVKQKSMLQVPVYVLCGVSGALVLILIYTVWSSINGCRKREAQQT